MLVLEFLVTVGDCYLFAFICMLVYFFVRQRDQAPYIHKLFHSSVFFVCVGERENNYTKTPACVNLHSSSDQITLKSAYMSGVYS